MDLRKHQDVEFEFIWGNQSRGNKGLTGIKQGRLDTKTLENETQMSPKTGNAQKIMSTKLLRYLLTKVN